MALHRLPCRTLKDAPFVPRTLWDEPHHDTSVFDDIREQDISCTIRSIRSRRSKRSSQQASPTRTSSRIKMTLYRIGANSPLIDMLIDAADAGKQVAVLVELKARFDERNNIEWATRLEAAGVHVVYGVENLKTHCKLCLVVRQEPDGVRRYAHIGTGNYNRATAQVYTDFGLFTADPSIVRRRVGGVQLPDRLLAAHGLPAAAGRAGQPARRLLALIERELDHARQGRPAHVIVKNNAVTDPAIVRALYRASQAGVEIDLIVRGVCCLQSRRARRQRAHPRPLGRRPLPRTLARLLVRQRRARELYWAARI